MIDEVRIKRLLGTSLAGAGFPLSVVIRQLFCGERERWTLCSSEVRWRDRQRFRFKERRMSLTCKVGVLIVKISRSTAESSNRHAKIGNHQNQTLKIPIIPSIHL